MTNSSAYTFSSEGETKREKNEHKAHRISNINISLEEPDLTSCTYVGVMTCLTAYLSFVLFSDLWDRYDGKWGNVFERLGTKVHASVKCYTYCSIFHISCCKKDRDSLLIVLLTNDWIWVMREKDGVTMMSDASS